MISIGMCRAGQQRLPRIVTGRVISKYNGGVLVRSWRTLLSVDGDERRKDDDEDANQVEIMT